MHSNNLKWLRDVKARLPQAFTGKVLEVGSNEPTLRTRSFFERCDRYVGLDQAAGLGVDLVGNLRDVDFQGAKFDTVVMVSVFEHDPMWRDSLRIGIDLLNDDGFMLIGFGPEGNPRHDPEPWRPVGHKEFLLEVCKYDVAVLEAFFEEQRYGTEIGCFDAVIRKGAPELDAWRLSPWYSPGRYRWQEGM